MRKAKTGLRSNAIRSISDALFHAAFESTAKEGEALVNVLKGIKQMIKAANRNDDTLSNIAHLSSVVALRFEKMEELEERARLGIMSSEGAQDSLPSLHVFPP